MTEENLDIYILWHRNDNIEQLSRVKLLKEAISKASFVVGETTTSFESATKEIDVARLVVIIVSQNLINDSHFDKADHIIFRIIDEVGEKSSTTKPVVILNNDTRTFEPATWAESALGFHFGTRFYINAHTDDLMISKALPEILNALS